MPIVSRRPPLALHCILDHLDALEPAGRVHLHGDEVDAPIALGHLVAAYVLLCRGDEVGALGMV